MEDNSDTEFHNNTEIDEAYTSMYLELNGPACWSITITNKVLDILIEKGLIQNVQSIYTNN